VQPARIVTHLLAVLTSHYDQILFFVRALDSEVLSGFDAGRLAASRARRSNEGSDQVSVAMRPNRI
jgi:hypothetical protein